MRLDWQWPGAVVFAVVFASLAALVYFGKVPHDALIALVAWLIPSPIQKKAEP